MKRFVLISIFLVITQMMLNAQITLDHSFISAYPTYPSIVHLENSGEKWMIIESNKIYLYNLDYTTFKIINIPPQQTTSYSISNISDKLFDLDSSIEYLLIAYSPFIVTVYKEDGTILLTEGGGTNQAKVSLLPGPVFNTANGTKLAIDVTSTITNINESKIYSLPGNLITSQSESEIPSDGRYLSTIYPNPNNGNTTIKYQLLPNETKGEVLFFNLDGRIVKTFKVFGSVGHIQIDNSDLPSGTYLYIVRTDMNTSETKKMIIIR